MSKVYPVDPETWQGGKVFCKHQYYVKEDGTTDCPACKRERNG